MSTETETTIDVTAPIVIGGKTWDLAGVVNKANILAMVRKGITHYHGNEQAAKLTAWKKTEEGQAATEEEIAKKYAEFQNAAFERFMTGEVGLRLGAGGTRKTAFESICRSIAVEMISAALKRQKLSMPKGDKTIQMSGKDFTREALIERALVTWKDKIEQEAKHRLETVSAESDEELSELA
jgi:hypothetical protein